MIIGVPVVTAHCGPAASVTCSNGNWNFVKADSLPVYFMPFAIHVANL